MELPAYRLPSARSVLLHMWQKAKDFLRKAFTIIFVASIVIWVLQSFSWSLQYVEDSAQSILASIGGVVAPLFKPLGFGDWRAATAILTGFSAKESVVSTLSVLTGAASDGQLSVILQSMLSPAGALSFLTFTILYMPFVAAFAASKREMGSWKGAIGNALYQTGAAYVVALVVYFVARMVL